MRSLILLLCVLTALPVLSQDAPPAQKPETKIGSINGKAITVGDLRRILTNAPETVVAGLDKDPKDFFERLSLLEQLSAEAKASGLDKVEPYLSRLTWQRDSILMVAELSDETARIPVSEQELQASYQANLAKYRTAEVTLIRVPYGTAGSLTQPEAKARAEQAVKMVRDGASFPVVARQFSSEPRSAEKENLKPINPATNLPEMAKKVIFTTLPGQVTDPINVSDSYVIFRVESLKPAPFASVEAAIRREIQQVRTGTHIQSLQASIKAEVLIPDFFKSQSPLAAPGSVKADFRPESVVAAINGRQFTAATMIDILAGAPPNARQNASQQPLRFLVEYETLRRMSDSAVKKGLDKKPPYSDHLRWAEMQVLMQGQIDTVTKSITNTPEEQRAHYDNNQDRFRVAKVKLIYIPFSLSPPPGSSGDNPATRSEAQARARSEEIRKQLAAGTRFVSLVEKFSEDADSKAKQGDFMDIRYTDERIPADIKKAIFAAKAGDVTETLRQPNGLYIFRIESNVVTPYEQVRSEVYQMLSDEKFKKWFEAKRASIKVEIENLNAIRSELPPPV
jgi:parvulin-like peptidyl-prolyl isomerase